MKKLVLLTLLTLFFTATTSLYSQEPEEIKAEEYLSTKGEVYFSFNFDSKNELTKLTQLISIDKITGNVAYAFANRRGFTTFLEKNIPYSVQMHPGDLLKDPVMFDGSKAIWDFDTYPTYQEYVSMMNDFQTNNPELCEIIEIGTTVNGRKQLFAKISKNVSTREKEPRFMYTSTMHGDETTGYVIMLHLINYLLSNYGTDPEVTQLLDSTEIWINPLENPDGAYKGGDNTVSGSIRFNGNGEDLNRNYKNQVGGDHPDGAAWQPEALSMMALMDTTHFIMSANCHGGASVANYPWDSWTSSQQIHADDDWWQYVTQNYADSAIAYSQNGYFQDVTTSGITNGGDWYIVYGTRQEYMTYYAFGREITLELSTNKTLSESLLLSYWGYNYRSMLNYMKEVQYGIKGTITDSVTGEPLVGSAIIANHDFLNSHAISELPYGDYYRPIYAGVYDITYDAAGYKPKTYTVSVANGQATIINAQLVKGPASALFIVEDSVLCSGQSTAQFINLSMDADSCLWDFGDGDTSSSLNPSHTYLADGLYDVTLIAFGVYGNDTLTLNSIINVSASNPCIFTLPTTGSDSSTECTGILFDSGEQGSYTNYTNATFTIAPFGATSVTLTFSSFNFESGYDYLYIYDGLDVNSPLIGQYSGATLPNGGTIVSTNGSITLRQFTDGGVVDQGFELIWNCTMPTSTPVVVFSASSTSSCTGEIDFFDETTNGAISWLWDFGDGTVSSFQNPSHLYTQSGNYSVTLTVWNQIGSDSYIAFEYIGINLTAAPSTTPASRCGIGDIDLIATGQGELSWFDDPYLANLLGTGDTLHLTNLNTTTDFYVRDAIIPASSFVGETNNSSGGSNYSGSTSHYQIFDCFTPVKLVSVEVRALGAKNRTIELRNSTGAILQSATVNIPDGTSRVVLNFDIPVDTNLRLAAKANPDLYRNGTSATLSYPYEIIDTISITQSSAGNSGGDPLLYYYFFYDWEVAGYPCYSATIPVTAEISQPPAVTISGDSSICAGNSVSLVANGASSYIWSNSDTSSSITLSPDTSGTITVEGTTGQCSSSDSQFINVTALPTLVANILQTICAGENASLSVSGADSYVWSTGDTIDSFSITPDSTNAYTVTGTTNGCSGMITDTISVNPLPVVDIGQDMQLCTGNSLDISVSSTGIYSWNTGETTAAISVSPIITSSYSVTVTHLGCSSSDSIVVVPIPSPSVTNAVTGESVAGAMDGEITAVGSGGTPIIGQNSYLYYWNTLETSMTITGLSVGIYSVTITDANGCTDSSTDTVSVITLFSDWKISGQTIIYPNPTNGKIQIESSIVYIESIEIVNMLGTLVLKKENMGQSFVLDLSELQNGMYFLTLYNPKSCFSTRIVLAK